MYTHTDTDRHRQTDRQTDTDEDTDTHRQAQTDRQTDRHRRRHRYTQTGTDTLTLSHTQGTMATVLYLERVHVPDCQVAFAVSRHKSCVVQDEQARHLMNGEHGEGQKAQPSCWKTRSMPRKRKQGSANAHAHKCTRTRMHACSSSG